MGDRGLAKLPRDGGTIGLRHAVLIPLVLGLAMGPGCGAVVGAMYGAPWQGAIFGAVLFGFACAVTLPAILKRGMVRGR